MQQLFLSLRGSGGNICAAYGFAKTIRSTWDWTSNSGHSIDTYITSDTDGGVGLGPNGILVVDFVPTGPPDNLPNIALISAHGYPAPNMTNVLTVAISTSPCTLYADEPRLCDPITSPTVSFGVGAVTASGRAHSTAVSLTPGVRYYINVAGATVSPPIRPTALQRAFRAALLSLLRLSTRVPKAARH
jgi:hypothetical protein